MLDKLLSPAILAMMIPIVAIIAYYWHLTCKVNSNNELKRDMLERGMSAEEIERVLNAGKADKEE